MNALRMSNSLNRALLAALACLALWSGFSVGAQYEEGVHYQPGFSTNAAITWEIHGVREKLAYRGMIQRKAAEVIREQVGA